MFLKGLIAAAFESSEPLYLFNTRAETATQKWGGGGGLGGLIMWRSESQL